MEWTGDLSVGIDEIDEQHKELIRRINDLVDSVRQKSCKYKIGDVIKFLEEYVVVHFGEEEGLMEKYAYPEYKPHRAQHEYFMREFPGSRKSLRNSRAAAREALTTSLSRQTGSLWTGYLTISRK